VPIYGDTDSTFVWLRRAHGKGAAQIGEALVKHVNEWWREHVRQAYGLESASNCSSKPTTSAS
jgi:DNA polymerase-2